MDDPTKSFGNSAQKLARNPLGIIALFIVLVYGLAALVTGFADSSSPEERLPLVYFLVLFPVLVLGVFAWLVSRHSNKLFGPSDFKDEENYVKILTATASLAVASVKSDTKPTSNDISAIVEAVREASAPTSRAVDGAYWRTHLLWVDDRPDNNISERYAFEAMGLSITLSFSTSGALRELEERKFAAIISDMGRSEGPREGYVLLDALRQGENETPFFIYASSNAPEHKKETHDHGGQGCTNQAQELFQMVMQAILKR
jgi:hypothetical protein